MKKSSAWPKGSWNQIMFDLKSTFTLKLSISFAKEQHYISEDKENLNDDEHVVNADAKAEEG